MAVRPIHILAAAVAITLLNAAKPAVVDDTAYLLFARHLRQKPFDPYGWQLFWEEKPKPAMEILLPPVLPYWLALGIRIFGEHLFLLKLWLFPFAWILCWSVAVLLGRFGSSDRESVAKSCGTGRNACAFGCIGRNACATRALYLVFVFSPALLPLFNFMLDIPALAVGTAALGLFVSGIDRRRIWWCAVAGVLAGLAMQTKYSMLTVPLVMSLYVAVAGQSWRAGAGVVLAGVTTLTVFGGWELYLVLHQGESHFLHHLQVKTDLSTPKPALIKSLLGQFGGLMCGMALVAGRAAGWPAWLRMLGGVGVIGLFTMIACVPHRWNTATGTVDLAFVGFLVCGIGALLTVGMLTARQVSACAMSSIFPPPLVEGRSPRSGGRGEIQNQLPTPLPAASPPTSPQRGEVGRVGFPRDTLFLIAWVVIELVGMFVLSPFSAARRLVGVNVALTILVAHGISGLRVGVDRWAVAVAIAVGVFLFAVDCWDAYPEKVLVEQVAKVVKSDDGHTVWYTGHWGFQYYAERQGMQALEKGTRLHVGDWLVLPVMDNPVSRPAGVLPVELPSGLRLEVVAELTWKDRLRARTIPELYGGAMPMKGDDGPRFRVIVGRVMATR